MEVEEQEPQYMMICLSHLTSAFACRGERECSPHGCIRFRQRIKFSYIRQRAVLMIRIKEIHLLLLELYRPARSLSLCFSLSSHGWGRGYSAVITCPDSPALQDSCRMTLKCSKYFGCHGFWAQTRWIFCTGRTTNPKLHSWEEESFMWKTQTVTLGSFLIDFL